MLLDAFVASCFFALEASGSEGIFHIFTSMVPVVASGGIMDLQELRHPGSCLHVELLSCVNEMVLLLYSYPDY
jgi:hypothetical protein